MLENLDWIVNEHGLNSQSAEIIAAMANGSLSNAQMMIDENWLLVRKWLIAEIQRLSLQPMARLFALAEKLAREKESLACSASGKASLKMADMTTPPWTLRKVIAWAFSNAEAATLL